MRLMRGWTANTYMPRRLQRSSIGCGEVAATSPTISMTISYGSASSVRRATREEPLRTKFVKVCPYLVVPPDLVYVHYDAHWHAISGCRCSSDHRVHGTNIVLVRYYLCNIYLNKKCIVCVSNVLLPYLWC